MIRLRIREIAEKRGINSAWEFQNVLGIKSPDTAASLWHGRNEKIALATLDALCEKLNCKPNDLLEFKRTTKAPAVRPIKTDKGKLRRARS